jgi:hypothetical protein
MRPYSGKEDRVEGEGDMGGSLTPFTDLRHRLPQQTAAWEPYEMNVRRSLGVSHEQPPFVQPNVAICIGLMFLSPFSHRTLSTYPRCPLRIRPTNRCGASITPWPLGTTNVTIPVLYKASRESMWLPRLVALYSFSNVKMTGFILAFEKELVEEVTDYF